MNVIGFLGEGVGHSVASYDSWQSGRGCHLVEVRVVNKDAKGRAKGEK